MVVCKIFFLKIRLLVKVNDWELNAMKRTIAQVATEILKSAKQPMTAAEITQAILDQNLYEFNAKDPKSIVRSAIERHCEGVDRRNSAAEKYFSKQTGGAYSLN